MSLDILPISETSNSFFLLGKISESRFLSVIFDKQLFPLCGTSLPIVVHSVLQRPLLNLGKIKEFPDDG
jgi:hypothetical protein